MPAQTRPAKALVTSLVCLGLLVPCLAACSAVYAEAVEPAEAGADTDANDDAPDTLPSYPDAAREAAATPDADAAIDSTPCLKKPNGGLCAQSSECCGKCTAAKKCNDTCKAAGDACDSLASDECCVGTYCGALCRPCRAAGQTPDNAPLSSNPSAKSCCSKSISNATLKCD